jgi:hypothetical protein
MCMYCTLSVCGDSVIAPVAVELTRKEFRRTYFFSRRIMAAASEFFKFELALGLLRKHVNKYRID